MIVFTILKNLVEKKNLLDYIDYNLHNLCKQYIFAYSITTHLISPPLLLLPLVADVILSATKVHKCESFSSLRNSKVQKSDKKKF